MIYYQMHNKIELSTREISLHLNLQDQSKDIA